MPVMSIHIMQVEALIGEQGNCTMLNVSGQTPLDVACQNGRAQVSDNQIEPPYLLLWGQLILYHDHYGLISFCVPVCLVTQ